MVDCRATSHIITDLTKFKTFDEEFQAKTHCVELADGTRRMGVAEQRSNKHSHCEVCTQGKLFQARNRNPKV